MVVKSPIGGPKELCPVGNQQAVCIGAFDIGTQEGSYNGKQNFRLQLIIVWELAEKLTTGDFAGKPFQVSKFYTASLGEKANLLKDLQSWRGRPFTAEELAGFEMNNLVGANCLLNIVATKKTDGSDGRQIAAISPLVKGMAKIEPSTTDEPKWIQGQREKSVEWREQHAEEHAKTAAEVGGSTPNDEDLPF
jgi:hypothetical protein